MVEKPWWRDPGGPESMAQAGSIELLPRWQVLAFRVFWSGCYPL